jgi:hypothetical protein
MNSHSTDDLVRKIAHVHDDSLAGFAGRPAARTLLVKIMILSASSDGPALSTTRRGFRLQRVGLRLVAASGLAVAIAAGTTVAQNLGGTDERGNPRPVVPGIPAVPAANAAQVLDWAATAAEARPYLAPRPDQWIYIEHKGRAMARTRAAGPNTPLRDFTQQTWWSADGKQIARMQPGNSGDKNLRIENGVAGWKHHYPTLAAMPTDPAALPDFIMARPERGGHVESDSERRSAVLYQEYSAILRNGVAPPKVEAAVFRALSALPGVVLKNDAVDVAGRPAISVARVVEGYLHFEILIDRQTSSYLGERVIVIKDHTSTGTDGTLRMEKGAIMSLSTRTASAIVDKPGQRP